MDVQSALFKWAKSENYPTVNNAFKAGWDAALHKADTVSVKTVKEILAAWLRAHGYDGLCMPEGDCGCGVDELMLCESCPDGCIPAYRRKCQGCNVRDCEMQADGGLLKDGGCYHRERLQKETT